MSYGVGTNCYTSGNVSGSNYVGGLVGLGSGSATHCHSTAAVSGNRHIGGLLGFGSATHCYSTGSVSGYSNVGGLVGYNGDNINVSYSTGLVGGEYDIGGLVGSNGGTLTQCYSTAAVSGTSSVGGLVGYNGSYGSSSVTQCYSSGTVSGKRSVGGLVGHNGLGGMGHDFPGYVTQCYSTAAVSGESSVGGLVGANSYAVNDCYSTGSVNGSYDVGGFVGYNIGGITTSYSTGLVSGTSDVGGLVGSNTDYFGGEGIASYSFWDVQTSEQATSAGGVGLTTTEMMDPHILGLNGFANDPNWVLDAGQDYPRLAWEGTPGNTITEPNIDWLDGRGTSENPYRIDAVDQLMLLTRASALWDKHFVLGTDIDMDPNLPGGQVFAQAVIPAFTGVFDGNGHIISHLTIVGESYLGLFGQVESGADVRDLGVVDVNVHGSGRCFGGLVGWNRGSIVASYSSGSVGGTDYVGGLVGHNDRGSISSSYSSDSVGGTDYVGGLVGENYDGIVTRCFSSGLVSGGGGVGGLVGDGDLSSVTHSVWDTQTSDLSGSAGGVGLTTTEMMDPHILGLNGFANDPNWVLDAGQDYPRLAWEGTPGNTITEPNIDWLDGRGTSENPYRIDAVDQLMLLTRASALWDKHFVLGTDIDMDPNLPGGQVFAQAVIPAFTGVFDGNGHIISHLTIVGESYLGLFGQVESGADVRDLGVVDVNVSGSGGCVGGIVGNNRGAVNQCYSIGSVSGNSIVGGLAGLNWNGRIVTCYSTGTVTGDSRVGGLVGSNDVGAVIDCYSTGAVSGISSVGVGGLVGNSYRGSINASFWDIETSGQATSKGGTGKTTAEMQTASTFIDAGWDFVDETTNGTEDIWWILEGQDYPRLWWELIPEN